MTVIPDLNLALGGDSEAYGSSDSGSADDFLQEVMANIDASARTGGVASSTGAVNMADGGGDDDFFAQALAGQAAQTQARAAQIAATTGEDMGGSGGIPIIPIALAGAAALAVWYFWRKGRGNV